MTNENNDGKRFYPSHRDLVRECAESTKVRIVFDVPAKENYQSPSFNDCLETDPPLQNLMWDISVRNRVRPNIVCVDIKQAFLHIRIKEQGRDVIRFH